MSFLTTGPRMPLGRRRFEVVGALCWLAQPLYIVAELLVAASASASYSLRDNTISDLGSIGCSPALCSPWHPAMNTAFVVFSLLRVAGALLLLPSWRPGRWAVTATVLWVVSGVFSAAIGFVPVDQHPSLHVLVAVPVFVTQPLAVLATGLACRGTHGGLTASGVMVGLGCLIGAGAFLVVSAGLSWVGFWERFALWPVYPWLAVIGVVVLASRGSGRHSATSTGVRQVAGNSRTAVRVRRRERNHSPSRAAARPTRAPR